MADIHGAKPEFIAEVMRKMLQPAPEEVLIGKETFKTHILEGMPRDMIVFIKLRPDPEDSLEGKTCFECGAPAQLWRTHNYPIAPWCYKCRFKSLYGEVQEVIINENDPAAEG